MDMQRIYTKEGYRLFRQDWKEIYKELSKLIRSMKNDIRETQKKGMLASQLQSDLTWRQKEAREMMQTLEDAKEHRRLITKKAA